MRYLMFLLGLMLSGTASAIDCEKVPDCESLGYSQQEDKDCEKGGFMYCPFDQNYKVCVQYNCAALGFTESDKSSWCADLIECKGNKKMTLCQKACVATKYEELKDLAGSGKCKLITMKDDITIPKNETLTLAANTIIDGGNHTLTSSGDQANYIVIKPSNKTGLKNIKIHHTQTKTHQGVMALNALHTDAVSLENVDIVISSDDATTPWANAIGHGIYSISGNFLLETNFKHRLYAFWAATYNFTNAQVTIKGNSVGIADTSTLTFTNSTIHIDTSCALFIAKNSVTFKNSKAYLKGGLLGTNQANTENLSLILEGGADVSLNLSYFYDQGAKMAIITLKGSTDNPAVLKMNYSTKSGEEKTNIVSTNTTDKLVLNDTTYRAKVPSTTLLSQIPSSSNWEVVQ